MGGSGKWDSEFGDILMTPECKAFEEIAALQRAVQKAEADAQGVKILRAEKDSQVERVEFKITVLKRELEEARGCKAQTEGALIVANQQRDTFRNRAAAAEARVKELEQKCFEYGGEREQLTIARDIAGALLTELVSATEPLIKEVLNHLYVKQDIERVRELACVLATVIQKTKSHQEKI